MKQLPLDVRLASHAVFDSFHAGPNALAVARLQRVATGEETGVTWLSGGAGCGKSHLLQASVALAYAQGRVTAYLPLAQLVAQMPGVLDGLAGYDLVALDDVAVLAGHREWELALLHLYEQLASRNGALMAAGEGGPAQSGISLADLSSRLSSGGVFRLEPLDDYACLRALQKRAQWLGLSLPEETGEYLLARVSRQPARLFGLLDQLDRASLAAQRRLTVPFVRSVIEATLS